MYGFNQLGKEVGFRMTHYSEMKIGRIVGHCEGWIAVDVWIPQGAATKSTRHRNGLPSWTKPEEPERITIQDTQAFPLSTTLLCKDTREIYSVDDSSEWIAKCVENKLAPFIRCACLCCFKSAQQAAFYLSGAFCCNCADSCFIVSSKCTSYLKYMFGRV